MRPFRPLAAQDMQLRFYAHAAVAGFHAYVAARNLFSGKKPVPPPPPPNPKPSSSGAQSTPGDPNQHKPPVYEPSPKHGQEQKGNISAAPKDGQTALDNSVQVKDTSPRRVGIDPVNKQIVVLDQTQGATEESGATFHGHVPEWDRLTSQQQNALKDAGLVDKKGNIITPGTPKP